MTDQMQRAALEHIAEVANFGAKKLGEIDPSYVSPKIAGSNNAAIERFWLIARTAKAALEPKPDDPGRPVPRHGSGCVSA